MTIRIPFWGWKAGIKKKKFAYNFGDGPVLQRRENRKIVFNTERTVPTFAPFSRLSRVLATVTSIPFIQTFSSFFFVSNGTHPNGLSSVPDPAAQSLKLNHNGSINKATF